MVSESGEVRLVNVVIKEKGGEAEKATPKAKEVAPPGSLSLTNKAASSTKDPIKRRMEIQKQKQLLIEKQIKHQKVIAPILITYFMSNEWL